MGELGKFFRGMDRRVYVSTELAVYYPGEPWFAPNPIAVFDVEASMRERRVVSAEGDRVGISSSRSRSRAFGERLREQRCTISSLGVPESFILDRKAQRILGYCLDDARARAYRRIVSQAGRWASPVPGLDLVLEAGRPRFFAGSAALLEADELFGMLAGMVDGLVQREEEFARAIEVDRQRASEAERRVARLASGFAPW